MLPIVLRIVSVLIAGAVILRLLLVGATLPAPIIIIVILVVLSFTYSHWPRVSAIVSLIVAVLVPVMVLIGYLNGKADIALLIFDSTIFLWVILSAIHTLRTRSGEIN